MTMVINGSSEMRPPAISVLVPSPPSSRDANQGSEFQANHTTAPANQLDANSVRQTRSNHKDDEDEQQLQRQRKVSKGVQRQQRQSTDGRKTSQNQQPSSSNSNKRTGKIQQQVIRAKAENNELQMTGTSAGARLPVPSENRNNKMGNNRGNINSSANSDSSSTSCSGNQIKALAPTLTTATNNHRIASSSSKMSSSSSAAAAASLADNLANDQHHDDHRKQNHCEIEKRRRDKMNHYIMELASVIPALTSSAHHHNHNHQQNNNNHRQFCSNSSSGSSNNLANSASNQNNKLDKLTVLRMAVQHVKSLRSSLCSFSSFHLRPSFLSSGNLLKNLILQMAAQEAQDNLFMVVTCDRGKILFVSQSSKDILNQDQNELVGQCLFDILHKDDVSKVKEQISCFSLMPREMLVDSKTFQPIKHNHRCQSFARLQNQANSTPQPGARRSFFCRMKNGRSYPSFSAAADKVAPLSTNRANQQQGAQATNQGSVVGAPANSNSVVIGATKQTTQYRLGNPDTTTQETGVAQQQLVAAIAETNDHKNEKSTGSLDQVLPNVMGNQSSSAASRTSDQRSNSMKRSHDKTAQCHEIRATNNGVDLDEPRNRRQSTIVEEDAIISGQDMPGNNLQDNNDSRQRNIIGKQASKTQIGTKSSKGAKLRENSTSVDNSRKSSRGSASSSCSSSSSITSNSSGGSSCSGGSSSGIGSSSSQVSSDNQSVVHRQDHETRTSLTNRGTDPSSTQANAKLSGTKIKTSTQDTNNSGDTSIPKDNGNPNPSNETSNQTATPVPISGRSSKNCVKKAGRYIIMHCTGYLKSLTIRQDEFDDDDFDDCLSDRNSSDEEENDSCRTVNCLVAVCRRSPMDRDLKPDRPLTFTCRYSMEGKFVFVDQRTTVALGYTPQQLLGTSHYAYCHKDSVNTFKECHRQCILKSEPVSSDIYQFKRANGQHLWLQTSLKSFRNPWTKFIDYIVANHTTAEGSDPHYNEGCVPTKFNQDMTSDASQSASPASSSSLCSPSVDSKKSSSPSSSSMGSSFSVDSFNSGGGIQALLNHIDKVKSGGPRHIPNFHKKRGDTNGTRTSAGSAMKSNEDSGNYSDLQSCSSVSSQLSSEFGNVQAVIFNGNQGVSNNQPQQAVSQPQQQQQQQQQRVQQTLPQQQQIASNRVNNLASNQVVTQTNYYGGQKSNVYRPNQVQQTPVVSESQQICPPQQEQQPNMNVYRQQPMNGPCSQMMQSAGQSQGVPVVAARGPRMAMTRVVRPLEHGATKPHQRLYGNQYLYRAQTKSASDNNVGSNGPQVVPGQNVAQWNLNVPPQIGISVNMYPPNQQSSCQNGTQMSSKSNASQQQGYVLHSIDTRTQQSMNDQVIRDQSQQVAIRGQIAGSLVGADDVVQDVDGSYLNELISYMSMDLDVSQHYNAPTSSTSQQSQQVSCGNRSQGQADMNSVPMIWNTSPNMYQSLNQSDTNRGSTMIGGSLVVGQQQQQTICDSNGEVTLMSVDIGNANDQMTVPQIVTCQQCANPKCPNQQVQAAQLASSMALATSNTDLNSINLTSLAVDGDLDEDQLLEYLAGCDPEAQLYQIQNQSYPQYNIYR